MNILVRTPELSTALRQGRQYGIVSLDEGSRFHILKPDSFPAAFECGIGLPEERLVDFYPFGACCANCIRIVEARHAPR